MRASPVPTWRRRITTGGRRVKAGGTAESDRIGRAPYSGSGLMLDNSRKRRCANCGWRFPQSGFRYRSSPAGHGPVPTTGAAGGGKRISRGIAGELVGRQSLFARGMPDEPGPLRGGVVGVGNRVEAGSERDAISRPSRRTVEADEGNELAKGADAHAADLSTAADVPRCLAEGGVPA